MEFFECLSTKTAQNFNNDEAPPEAAQRNTTLNFEIDKIYSQQPSSCTGVRQNIPKIPMKPHSFKICDSAVLLIGLIRFFVQCVCVLP